MSAPQVQSKKMVIHFVLTVVGMTGIAGLFLPFVYGVSPLAAAFQEHMWLLALRFSSHPWPLPDQFVGTCRVPFRTSKEQ